MRHDEFGRAAGSATAASKGVVNKHVGIVDAVRELLPLVRGPSRIVSPEDFRFIIAVESETDDLPVGNARGFWGTAALSEKDEEIKRCEGLWDNSALPRPK